MNRITIINDLIKKYNYRSYLEIGVYKKNQCFNHIICEFKISVDPSNIDDYSFNMTSDQFFSHNKYIFDIIFIDGLHTAEQAEKDILNSLNILNNNGILVVHDTNPPTEFTQMEKQANSLRTPAKYTWNGTVWKTIFKLRKTRDDLIIQTLPYEEGITIIKKGKSKLLTLENPYYSYDIFDQYRKEILNIQQDLDNI